MSAPGVVEWDEDLELVRFATCSARWDPAGGDPRSRSLFVVASWHDNDEIPAPSIIGEITDLYERSALYRLDGRESHMLPGSLRYRRVPTVPRFPRERSSGNVQRQFTGVVATLRVDACTEPTTEDIAAHHTRIERRRRTLYLTGPASSFGATVPAAGGQLSIDLGDPRITKRGHHASATGVVRGTLQQVGVAVGVPEGYSTISRVEAGIPAGNVTAPLFVVLTIDATGIPGTPP
ncbi:hypothetical protein DW322_18575 [Rhodococcus rhodnii]|uniref:Uncharacterized protein n=2 Tax=Rhodococcus rhodnii TaxID=38312 RepID=R7WQB3_9NOCA|nr:hypothetical protein [Rhodococcus rhodnii]EOM76179.1 hypothetical protein Rrhod_2545 [Rhodococcus rhodnii LMG 5362]TXG91820.1 hypothetical protein DW322_18575 [Rhodococcus rhodnii]